MTSEPTPLFTNAEAAFLEDEEFSDTEERIMGALARLPEEQRNLVISEAKLLISKIKERQPRAQMSLIGALEVLQNLGIWRVRHEVRHE